MPAPALGVANSVAAFKSAAGIATAAKVLLGINVVTAGIFGLFRFMERGVLTDFRDGVAPLQDLLDSDSRLNSIYRIMQISWLVSIIVFIIWFHRSRKNAAALGDEVPYKPGMAIGCWFIPLADLVMPAQIAVAMWRSDGNGNKRSGAPVILWWLAFIGGFIVRAVGESSYTDGVLALRAGSDSVGSFDKILSGDTVSGVGSFVLAVAAVLAILVVNGLSKSQDQRFATLTAGGDGVSYRL